MCGTQLQEHPALGKAKNDLLLVEKMKNTLESNKKRSKRDDGSEGKLLVFSGGGALWNV